MVPMHANYGNYSPSRYVREDRTIADAGNALANGISSLPGAMRGAEQWQEERGARARAQTARDNDEAQREQLSRRMQALNEELASDFGGQLFEVPDYRKYDSLEKFAMAVGNELNSSVVGMPRPIISKVLSVAGLVGKRADVEEEMARGIYSGRGDSGTGGQPQGQTAAVGQSGDVPMVMQGVQPPPGAQGQAARFNRFENIGVSDPNKNFFENAEDTAGRIANIHDPYRRERQHNELRPNEPYDYWNDPTPAHAIPGADINAGQGQDYNDIPHGQWRQSVDASYDEAALKKDFPNMNGDDYKAMTAEDDGIAAAQSGDVPMVMQGVQPPPEQRAANRPLGANPYLPQERAAHLQNEIERVNTNIATTQKSLDTVNEKLANPNFFVGTKNRDAAEKDADRLQKQLEAQYKYRNEVYEKLYPENKPDKEDALLEEKRDLLKAQAENKRRPKTGGGRSEKDPILNLDAMLTTYITTAANARLAKDYPAAQSAEAGIMKVKLAQKLAAKGVNNFQANRKAEDWAAETYSIYDDTNTSPYINGKINIATNEISDTAIAALEAGVDSRTFHKRMVLAGFAQTGLNNDTVNGNDKRSNFYDSLNLSSREKKAIPKDKIYSNFTVMARLLEAGISRGKIIVAQDGSLKMAE